MPLTPEHKKNSRKKILNSAFHLFTKFGFDNVSIDQVMHNAGMTRGAFYAHFSSKAKLYKEAISSAALQSKLASPSPAEKSDKEWIDFLLESYLSRNHVDQNETPCPLAFLTTDIALRDKDIRTTYSTIYKNMNKRIQHYTDRYSDVDENTLLAITAMMIGGVAIGRALNDQQLTDQLLKSCKDLALQQLKH